MHNRSNRVAKSSFHHIDSSKFFSTLGLRDESVFLDLGCGTGNYSIAASEYVGDKGRIYAIDKSAENLIHLARTIVGRNIKNIFVIRANGTKGFPLKKHCVEICLIAGVLHHLMQEASYDATLKEVKRVLKQDGRLSIIEFKQIEGPPGPPIDSRISAESLEDMLLPYGFRKTITTEIGPYHYTTLFLHQNGFC